ncbi:PBSX family phage terminase large subunit [uncultured Psychrobacter sp.]|uniref:PBSX family phage terminase large subunit n=1 Tax=uncultured Psychrobacter sp. TaxID=259303 RepID=UPI0025991A1B|nr:PBSX family phage terminase large subunit [uncultured Psychrobacter sp.]
MEKQTKTKTTLNPVLKEFWRTPARNRVLYGGRASSKSWDAAGFAIFLSNKYKLRFLCTRQIQNKIEESVYTLLKTQINRFKLQHRFRILNNKIINLHTGSEFVFYGLWRHVEEIKSLEGVDVCWIEEAHSLTKNQWEILEPTIRKDYSQFWVIFNPQLLTDFVYQKFIVNTPPNTIVRKINYTENGFLSQTMLDVIESKRQEDEDEFNHIYLGDPKEDDDLAIIKRSWVNAAIDAHIKLNITPTGSTIIGYDIADAGEDTNATVTKTGLLATAVDEWKGGEDELLKSCERAYNTAKDAKGKIIYDAIGVGASAGARFKQLNDKPDNRAIKDIEYAKFVAGASVASPEKEHEKDSEKKNQDMHSNLKAQAWWEVARMLRNTYNAVHKGMQFEPHELISISSDIDEKTLDKLKNELSTPRQDRDAHDKVMVESKKSLSKRGVKSPNLADAFIMACSPSLVKFKGKQSYGGAGKRTY